MSTECGRVNVRASASEDEVMIIEYDIQMRSLVIPGHIWLEAWIERDSCHFVRLNLYIGVEAMRRNRRGFRFQPSFFIQTAGRSSLYWEVHARVLQSHSRLSHNIEHGKLRPRLRSEVYARVQKSMLNKKNQTVKFNRLGDD
jgi:hypothetical protein